MSTEQKHTAGPWKVIENGNLIQIGGCWHSKEPVLEVATVTRFKLQNGMHDANARLIAAAPELLGALDPDAMEAIANEIDSFEHSARAQSLRLIAAKQRQAIAKATQ